MYIRSPKELALFIIDQRKKLKLSQSEVGKLIGVKQQTISDFENNPETTKLNTLFKILSAVQLDVELTGKDEINHHNKTWKEEW